MLSNALQCMHQGPRYGQSFAFHADLALRGALVALFCAATYVIPALHLSAAFPSSWALRSWWQSNGWSMSYVWNQSAFKSGA